MQNHQIKLLSEEASTSLRAAESGIHPLGSGDHVATTVKADPAEKSSEDEKKIAGSDSSKPGMSAEVRSRRMSCIHIACS